MWVSLGSFCFLYLNMFPSTSLRIFNHNLIRYIFYSFLSLSLSSDSGTPCGWYALCYSRALLNSSHFFSFCCSDWVVSIILSLTHFSVSPSLLLIPSSFFFKLMYFSVLTGSFFVLSSSLLKFSCRSSILFPNSAFLRMLWIFYLENCGFGFIIYIFLQGFLSFNWDQFLCLLMLPNFICMKSSETVT